MGSDSETEKSAHKEKDKKKLSALAPIAKPLAGKKLSKRTFKLVRRGILKFFAYMFNFSCIVFRFFFVLNFCLFIWFIAAENKCLKRGVKEVVKSIRRGNKGSVLLSLLFLNL